MPAFDFNNERKIRIPQGRKTPQEAILDLKGLDLVTPVDLMLDGHSPFAKNFRLYAQQSDDRRVAVSSRKGPGFYINPLNEASAVSNIATTGASTTSVNVLTEIPYQTWTAASNDRLTRIDIKVGNNNTGRGTLLVKIHADKDGKPGALLAESSISGGNIPTVADWRTARFHKAIKLTSGLNYWVVLAIQDDGSGFYDVVTTTAGTKAYKTNASLSTGTLQTFGLNFRTYTAVDSIFKGSYRFARDNGNNVTLVAHGTTMYRVDEGTQSLVSIATGLSASATEYSFANGDNKVFWVNRYDTLRAWNGTTVETITDTELPLLSQIIFHKDRLWGVTAADPNKLVFSENPGNPAFDPTGVTPTTPTQQWYYAWLSVSFIYVPRPHNGSPITGLVSFQDSLIVFTADRKYAITGYDRGSFFLREATGTRGALSRRTIFSDENSIYFASDDGLYEYNGSSDNKISERITPLFDGCPRKEFITPIGWKGKIRFYMASSGSLVNDICLLYNKELKEFEYDTETYVDSAVYYGDADDDQELIEFSSLAPVAFKAEQDYNSLGAAIDFEYQFAYNSLGSPAQRKRLLKFFPLFQGVDSTFEVNIEMDKDFQNSPRVKEVLLVVNGNLWGSFNWGDGTLFGGATSFKMQKLRFSGYGYYWQLRVSRKGVNNRVAFIGAQFSYKAKRI